MTLAAFGLAFVNRAANISRTFPFRHWQPLPLNIGLRLLDWSTWRRLPHMRRVDASAQTIVPLPSARACK